MDKDALKKDVEMIVSTIFSEKEDIDKKRLTEEALKGSAKVVKELTASVTKKEEIITDLESKISEAEITIAKQVKDVGAEKAKVEEVTKQLEDTITKLGDSESKMVAMEKDMTAEVRISDLIDSKVVSTDESAQRVKVREMSDEEFAGYKKELVELRKSIETELANVVVPDGDAPSVKPDVVTPDMDINVDNSEQAAFNLEVTPEDIVSDYTDLGKSMAAAWAESKS